MRLALVLAVLLASAPAPTASAQGTPGSKATSTPPRVRMFDTQLPAYARAAFAPLARAGWRATWDRDTGVPAWLTGGVVPSPGAVADPARAERAARDFLAEHVALLAPGASPADFALVANRLDAGLRTVTFRQTWRGLPVLGGQLGFVFGAAATGDARTDRLFAVASAAWPHVDVFAHGMQLHGPSSRGRAAAVEHRVESWLEHETGVATSARITGERAVVPRVSAGVIHYELADVLDARATTGPERWTVHAHAGDGTPLSRTSRIMFADGTLAYDAAVRHPGGARMAFPAPSTAITVDGSPVTTGSDGGFSWSGAASTTVVPALAGTFVRIINQAGALATDTLTVAPGQTVTWNRAADELADAQLSAYIYAGLAKQHARQIHPGVASWLDARVDVFVNENGSCNAYSTGDDIHLYRSSTSCENTARLADIVFHELGHSLHAQSVIDGMGAFETHLSEGLADFFAATWTQDSGVGRGFFRSDEPLRDLDPVGFERVYPIDFDFDPHISGLIIAGALWDLRKALIAEHGVAEGTARTHRVFTGVMQRANDIGATFMAALIADDDDADLGNGTPNYCAIERAFGQHGLVPDYETTTLATPVLDGLALAMTVTTPAGTTCPPPVVTRMTVTWQADEGVPAELELAGDGGGVWRGAFPEQPPATLLTYSIDVELDDGAQRSFPDNPADRHYQLFTGGAAPIWCETFDRDPMWQETSNAGLEWEWGSAGAAPGSLDPPRAFSGTFVLGTDLAGDGHYRSHLMTSVVTPPIDVRGYETVRLQYRRWLTVEDALFDQATVHANGDEVWRNASSINGTLDHVDREWRFHDIDVTPYVAGGTLEVRFGLASDFGKELGGWTLDDVCVVGLSATCGDGIVGVGEDCDDGNLASGDGCSATCTDELVTGGGGCCSGAPAPSGSLALGGLVLLWLRQRRKRSSSLLPSVSVSAREP